MKNIVYLLRTRKTYVPQVHVGVTNYLYRQILWHNHRWHPKEKGRKLPHPHCTPKKLGYYPINVVTGFPSENMAVTFKDLFNKTFAQMKPLDDVLNPKLYEDQVQYRQDQLVHVCSEYLDMASKGLLENTPKLKIHWANEEDYQKRTNLFPIQIEHILSLDVSEIDKLHYDANDAEDDRNYFALKAAEQEKRRLERIQLVAKDLGIEESEVERVLHQSRLEMKENLISRAGKAAKKAAKYIKINQ